MSKDSKKLLSPKAGYNQHTTPNSLVYPSIYLFLERREPLVDFKNSNRRPFITPCKIDNKLIPDESKKIHS